MIILDIETIAAPPGDPAVVAYLAKHPDKADALALSPWTGRVVCVAMVDNDMPDGRDRWCGRVSATDAGENMRGGWRHETMQSEATLLREVWHRLSGEQVCTWNGIGFDVPFLVGRSLVNGVHVDRSLLDAKPWESRHLDLMAKLGRASSLDA